MLRVNQLSGFGAARPSGAAPSIALVQQKVGTTADGSAGLTVGFDVPVSTNGNLIVACISFLDTAAFDVKNIPTTTGTDSPMIEAITETNTGVKTYIYYLAPAADADTGVTFTLDLPVRASVNISEWSRTHDNFTANFTSSATGTSSALGVVPATLDASPFPNLVIGMGGYVSADSDYSSGPSDSFTRLTTTGGAAVFQECAYLIRETDHSPVTSVVTLDEADVWASCAAAFIVV